MRLLKWLIIQASLLAVVFSVSLSGYGMAQAHSTMITDATGIEHSAHANMDHSAHDTTNVDHGSMHEDHANCPMIACCHTGGISVPSIPALTGVVTCQIRPSANLLLDKAEPESAKKPPKHV
ncbi:hypothetical protein [Roseovarius sp. EL26]|uniref:hypothetical protein n=1 Tax=Roseovarius sp. EL26 TaxID=2126672 RepID=UPI000EA142D2|nr:hypothetical protein [Roseovarius sp. EL26]